MTIAESATTVPVPPIPGGLDTPRLVIDLDVVEANVARLAETLAARGVRLRPHAKTHKSVAIARLQLAAGAVGITVGTIGEAEVFAAAGIRDIFIAYPIWAGGPKARRVRALHEAIELRVGVDSAEGVACLGAAVAGMVGGDRRLRVLVEVDSGGARTGVVSADQAVAVGRAARAAGLDVTGVFTHGGHSYAGRDAAAGAARDEVERLTAVAQALGDDGFSIETISAGSTPTMVGSATSPVNEIRAGTYALGDRQQLALGAIGPDALAAYVATTVVSAPAPGRYVLDAGAKTLTKDRAAFLDGHGLLPTDPDAVIECVNDYHGVVRAAPERRPSIGSVLAVFPNHVCPVVDLVDDFVAVRHGQVIGRWPVDARGRSG